MKEITEELLARMSLRVVEKLDALSRNTSEDVADDPKPEDREAVVKQVLRDELT